VTLRRAVHYEYTLNESPLAYEWAVVVNSWNEWPEGTQLEPSASYGDFYLPLTAAFAARLKG